MDDIHDCYSDTESTISYDTFDPTRLVLENVISGILDNIAPATLIVNHVTIDTFDNVRPYFFVSI